MTSLPRILLADDDPNDVELTLNALDEYRLSSRVDVVHDGQQALDYLRREGAYAGRDDTDPCVVVLDLKMPRVDGLEVLRAMSDDARLRMLPVVVLTSSHEDGDISASYRLSANAYVVKPVGSHDFINAVRGLGMFWGTINEAPPD